VDAFGAKQYNFIIKEYKKEEMNRKWYRIIAFLGPSLSIAIISLFNSFIALSLVVKLAIYAVIIIISGILYYLYTKANRDKT
jgi:hypothetical protein